MAEILLDNQGIPSTPAAGQTIVYPDTLSKLLTQKNDTGKQITLPGVRNASTAAQAYTTADVYAAGSALAIPSHLLQVGAIFRWKCVLTKTAGTGVPVWIIRVGTAGTVADTARVTFTQVSVPTSVTDTGIWHIEAAVRVAGAAGVLAGSLTMSHVLNATGFSLLDSNEMFLASAAFDMTVANLIVGLSFNHQTAGAGNIELVTAELVNG